MRDHVDPQWQWFNYFPPDERVPSEHPQRSIKTWTDAALKQISLLGLPREAEMILHEAAL
jgi:hypothetical protein